MLNDDIPPDLRERYIDFLIEWFWTAVLIFLPICVILILSVLSIMNFL
jgi:hypothetical protein